jgi:hypothetical protein
MVEHQPVLVQKRIFEGKDLWGVIGKIDNSIKRIGIRDMLGMMLNNVDFLVDVKGRDKPAKLMTVHRRSGNSLIFYFKTVGDSEKNNNFNKVEKISYSYARRVKGYKK